MLDLVLRPDQGQHSDSTGSCTTIVNPHTIMRHKQQQIIYNRLVILLKKITKQTYLLLLLQLAGRALNCMKCYRCWIEESYISIRIQSFSSADLEIRNQKSGHFLVNLPVSYNPKNTLQNLFREVLKITPTGLQKEKKYAKSKDLP